MSNIDHMLASIINKDKEGFSDAFSDEMKERLATSIIDKNLNISQDLLSDEEIDSEDVEEEVEHLDEIDRKKLMNHLDSEVTRVTHADKKHTPKTNKQKKLLRKLERKEKETPITRMPGILPYTPDQWAQHKKNMENLKDHVEPLEELRGAKFFPSGYTFKTTKDAKEFVVALKHMGLRNNTVSIKGKTVSLSDKLDASTPANHDRLSFIKNLAKDMKASVNESRVIGAIREAYISEDGVIYTLKDLENIHILPKDAESIIQIHDNLNEDNQTILREMLSETEESYYKVLDFCNEKCSKE
jgi:hypothetical protein